MTDLYNLTALKQSQNLVDLVLVANDATSKGGQYGILVQGFLIAFFIIMILSLMAAKKSADFLTSIFASSFVCFILSIFLRTANLISLLYVLVFGLIMSLTGFYLFMVDN